ncbi:hypothetical protein FPOA_05113 [Fusarium poae]|uniref:Lysine-specific metallo-endopeptidase domain-containing protein n=2 Tax=Fusarium poae TaxID=36050 RepID=A0A1B8AW38_FUSPO|nr:hypothetical protein FPOA_05113 [Fusarium poae]
MRLSSLWLVAGLSSSVLALPEASLEPWDIHSSCDPHKDIIKAALTQSIELADAAKSSLEIVLNKLPDFDTDKDNHIRWQRIATHIQMAFGYKIPSSPGPGDRRYTEALRDIYANAVRVLPSDKNSPERGNNPTLATRQGAKPVIACGDDVFQWYGPEDEPEPQVGKVKDQPQFQDRVQQNNPYLGALYFQGRWKFSRTQMNSLGVCFGNRQAVISAHDDLIIICGAMTSDSMKNRLSPKDFKASVTSGTKLQSGLVSFHTQLWHELCHWFGGVVSPTRLEHNIKDHPAVNKDGQVLYKGAGGIRAFDAIPDPGYLASKGLRKQGAYGIENMMELAMKHKKVSDQSGPDKATTNADSLMIFSLMMYNDQWDWTVYGKARDLARLTQKLEEANRKRKGQNP